MISNAGDSPIPTSFGLPNVGGALVDWMQPLTFTRVTKTVVNSEVVETTTAMASLGVRQPLSPRQLMLKPEGERAWRWEQIHALPDLVLVPDDIVIFNAKQYRVMACTNYEEYGYVEYHICQDYRLPA